MYVPGALCIIVGFYLMHRLRDTPQSLGLPPIEKFRDDYPTSKHEVEQEVSAKEILFKYVLNNRYVWLLAIAYFFIYVIRTAINDWSVLFLVEQKGYSVVAAAVSVLWFEAGGFCGSLVAGWASDKIYGGRRGPINVIFSMAVTLALAALWFSPGLMIVDFALMFIVGFLIYGPQMLIGMAAVELSHKKASGTATGFVGWVAYFGAAATGYPLGKIIQELGWYGFFAILAVCGVTAVLFLLPLWGAKTHPKYASEKLLPEA